MGSLTLENSPSPVGKVTVSSTFLGTRKNGDIVIDVCTRFSYPNLYNNQYTSKYPDTPSQKIDISATTADVVNACCDLYKISNQDLEFHMQLVLKNYNPSDSKRCHEESTATAIVKTEQNQNADGKTKVFRGERYSDQPYLFASCDNDETTTALEAIVVDEDDSDPLEVSNRTNQIPEPDSNLSDMNDTPQVDLQDDIIKKEEIIVKPELVTEVENVPKLKKKPRRTEPKLSVPLALAETKGEIYGFKSVRIESTKQEKSKTRCVFCNADVNHFPRHLERRHGDEKEVKAFSCLPKDSKRRSILIGVIRKRGNFTKISDNIIAPVRRPRESKDGLCFMACPYCKGIYSAQYVRRHFKRCHMNYDRKMS